MKRILLVSHTIGYPGPIHKYFSYLAKKYQVCLMLHPIRLDGKLPNTILYKNREFRFTIYPALQYFLEGIVSLFFVKRLNIGKIDLAICFDSLSFLHLYLLRPFISMQKIVYYNVDYSRKRYQNSILNFIYQKITFFAYSHCDFFFAITKKFVAELDPKGHFAYKNFSIKHTTNVGRIDTRMTQKKNTIVFAGTIDFNMDFDLILTAIKKLKEDNFHVTLDMYGYGEKSSLLKKMIVDLKLENNVFLEGLIDNVQLNKKLPSYMIGIAPYSLKRDPSTPDHAFHGTDLTLKLVEYIASGLPVVTTGLNEAFNSITTHKFGFLANTSDEWYSAIHTLLTNKTLYQTYRKNALKYAKLYDEEKVLGPIFEKILSRT